MQRHEQRRRPLVAVSAGLDGMKLDFNRKPGRRDGKPTGTTAPIPVQIVGQNPRVTTTKVNRNAAGDIALKIARALYDILVEHLGSAKRLLAGAACRCHLLSVIWARTMVRYHFLFTNFHFVS